MSRCDLLKQNMDIGIVHDGFGWYFAELFLSRSTALLFLFQHWLGSAFFQQARLERMAEAMSRRTTVSLLFSVINGIRGRKEVAGMAAGIS